MTAKRTTPACARRRHAWACAQPDMGLIPGLGRKIRPHGRKKSLIRRGQLLRILQELA